jgi:hypothetical protein
VYVANELTDLDRLIDSVKKSVPLEAGEDAYYLVIVSPTLLPSVTQLCSRANLAVAGSWTLLSPLDSEHRVPEKLGSALYPSEPYVVSA